MFAKIYLTVNFLVYFLGPPHFCLSFQQAAAKLLYGAQAKRVFELCMHVSRALWKKGEEEGRDAPGDVGEEWLKIKCEEGESSSWRADENMDLSMQLPKSKTPFRRGSEGLTVSQRAQLGEASEIVNLLSALVPLAPTLVVKCQIAATIVEGWDKSEEDLKS